MDPKQQKFLRDILHTVVRSAISSTMWRMGVLYVVIIGALAGFAIWYWDLY